MRSIDAVVPAAQSVRRNVANQTVMPIARHVGGR